MPLQQISRLKRFLNKSQVQVILIFKKVLVFLFFYELICQKSNTRKLDFDNETLNTSITFLFTKSTKYFIQSLSKYGKKREHYYMNHAKCILGQYLR